MIYLAKQEIPNDNRQSEKFGTVPGNSGQLPAVFVLVHASIKIYTTTYISWKEASIIDGASRWWELLVVGGGALPSPT